MKIYDLDHLETISDDVTVFGGGDKYLTMSGGGASNFNMSGGAMLTANVASISNYNTGNTVKPNTGIGLPTVTPRLNFVKSLASVTPSVIKDLGKLIIDLSSILKSRFLSRKLPV